MQWILINSLIYTKAVLLTYNANQLLILGIFILEIVPVEPRMKALALT